ncbi:MAG: methylated-DNA--[protein]-cysteine S-methyltransferase [Sideroxydans sp.]|jgi:methylated-DNA-[protein]-cysteine S-methyltransferase
MDYQAIINAPFGKLGIRCTGDTLLGVEFLFAHALPVVPVHAFAREACAQLEAYLNDASFMIDLPFELDGTHHQCNVWQEMLSIPCGQTRSYGELAAQIGSSARAVGQACGSNPIPLVIPCHRVVGKGGLGGFMHRADADALDIKRWLLAHERTEEQEAVISAQMGIQSDKNAGFRAKSGMLKPK